MKPINRIDSTRFYYAIDDHPSEFQFELIDSDQADCNL